MEYNQSTNRTQGGLVLLKIHNCSHLTATSPQSILTTVSVCTKPKFLTHQFLDVEDVDAELRGHPTSRGFRAPAARPRSPSADSKTKRTPEQRQRTRTASRAQAAPPPRRPQARQRLLPPQAGRSLQLLPLLRLRLWLQLLHPAHPERRLEGARRLVEAGAD